MISFHDIYRIVPEGSDTTEGRRFLASKRTEDYILVDQRYGQYVTVLWIHSYFLIFLTANVLLLCVQFFIFFFSFLHSSHTTFYFLCLSVYLNVDVDYLSFRLRFFSHFPILLFFFYPTALEPSLYLSCFILSNLVLSCLIILSFPLSFVSSSLLTSFI